MVSDEVLDLCFEYLEIAIGLRKPSELERQEAVKTWLQIVFEGLEPDASDVLTGLKYPISFEGRSQLLYNGIYKSEKDPLLAILEQEIYIFDMIEEESIDKSIISIPSIRYEIRIQKQLLEDDLYRFALLRQHALFETIFREESGVGEEKWRYTLESVYRGENYIDTNSYEKLTELNEARNDIAHNWFSYIQKPESKIRQIVLNGLSVMSKLLMKDLADVFTTYSNRHISKRHSAKLEDRATGKTSGGATVSVEISCDNCESKFNPQNHFKRCPDCYSEHDYWKTD